MLMLASTFNIEVECKAYILCYLNIELDNLGMTWNQQIPAWILFCDILAVNRDGSRCNV